MITEKFVESAESYVGTRYMHQGRLPGVGLDCAGVVVCAARAAGVEVMDVSSYSRNPSGMQLIAAVGKHCKPVYTEPECGDILAFAWQDEPQHLAVYVGGGYIVHAHVVARKVVKHVLDKTWTQRIVGAYRLKESA